MKAKRDLIILYIIFAVAVALAVIVGVNNYNDLTKAMKQANVDSVEPAFTVAIPKSEVDYNAMAELINIKRSQNGLRPVFENDRLDQSAQMKANDMIANDYWSHDSPTGVTPWKWFNFSAYKYQTAGENLAKCYKDPHQVVDAWYASPAHRANILGDYKEVGFGVGYMKDGCYLIVSHFGRV